MKAWNSSLKILTLAISLLGIATLSACGTGVEGVDRSFGDSGLVGLNPPAEGNATGEATPAPAAPVRPVRPATCYRYAFVSGVADNVFVTNTCSREAPQQLTDNDASSTHFGNLIFKELGNALVFDLRTVSPSGVRLESFTANLTVAPVTVVQNTAARFNGSASDYVPHALAFEPEGERTVFLRDETEGSGAGQNYQFVVVDQLSLFDPNDPAAGEQTLYQAPDADEHIAAAVWRPGRDELVVAKQRQGGNTHLFLFNIAGRGMNMLRAEATTGYYRPLAFEGSEPAFSPDGNTLSFVRRINGQRQVFACTFTSEGYGWHRQDVCGHIRQLTSEGENMDPTWTPDGRFLFFTSNRAGNLDLYRMNPEGTEQTPIRSSVADESRPAVDPIPSRS